MIQNILKLQKCLELQKKEIFWRITFPQLVPTIAFLSTVNLIGAFKVYTQVYALFGGTAGVANSATTAVYYIYDKFHVAGRPGIAMAATVILFVIILIATFFQIILEKSGGLIMKKVINLFIISTDCGFINHYRVPIYLYDFDRINDLCGSYKYSTNINS